MNELNRGNRSRLGIFPFASLLASLSVAACSSTLNDSAVASNSNDGGAAIDASDVTNEAVDETFVRRPYTLQVPASYEASKPMPLMLLLHGYGASGLTQSMYMRLGDTAEKLGFLFAHADGTLDSAGKLFWNATNACCNFGNIEVDDVAYITAILDDVAKKYSVDSKRVYLVGHSNGGFMAHRYACEMSSRVTAIVSVAGAMWKDASKCNPSEAVSVLQIHGTNDSTILYNGGDTGSAKTSRAYPSAHDTVATWASKDHCSGVLTAAGTKNVDAQIAGDETNVERMSGCPSGVDVELWTMQGGGHVPAFTYPGWGEQIYGFLSAHSKK